MKDKETHIKKEKVDMIVAGRKKRSLFEKVYVGTHLLDLIRRSPIPILMDKYMAEYEIDGKIATRVNDHIFDRPMLATDWSQPSSNAVDALKGLKGLATDVMVVHNLGLRILKAMSPVQLQELKKEGRRRLKEYCKLLFSPAGSFKYYTIISVCSGCIYILMNAPYIAHIKRRDK